MYRDVQTLRLQDAKEQRFGFRFLGEQKIAGSNLS